MPTLEATRKPQKENISPNKEQQSDAFTLPYTYRRLFGGGMDSFRDPFSGGVIQSDKKTELHFAEGAFSLPKDQAPLRKLCHSLGITPPVSKDDIPEFVRTQITEIKDSEGNNHFENQLISLLFPPPGKEQEAISAIQAADAPENPDSCAEIEVTINGQKLEAHAHGSYQGNNKSRIALFALLGHKPSQEFLAKWVEKDNMSTEGHSAHHDHELSHHHSDTHEDHEEHEHHAHNAHGHDEHLHAEDEHDHHDCGHDHSQNSAVTFNGSPEEIAQQVVTVISQRLETEAHHDTYEESVENAELTQEERIDSVASVTIAHIVSPEDADIQEAFDQLASNNYIGQIDLKKKEPEPLQQENEALTEHFVTTLRVLREELHQEQDEQTLQKQNVLLTLSLARLHNKEITLQDIQADHEYPPKDEKTAAIMLAKAIEVTTRPELDQQNLPQTERSYIDTALQLRQDYGISYINYTTSHSANNPFHKIVKPNGVIESCPDHAQETARLDQKLQESQKTVNEKLKQTYQPRRNLSPKPREVVRGVVQKKDTSQTQLTRPVLETLVALGNTGASEKLQSLEKQEAWDKRFNAAAEIIHGAVLVRNETTQELIETLMEEKFFGEITEEQMIRKPSKAISETNEKHTKTFRGKLAKARKEKPIASQELALTLAKMHDPTIETLSFDEKIPEYTQLTRADVVKILALDMALQTESGEKSQTPLSKKIARYARRINEEKGIHYVNLTMNHATALHLVEIITGGVKTMDPCPDHTQQVDKLLQKMQTVAKQQVAQFNQVPIRIVPFNRLQPVRGGIVEQPKQPEKKITPPPSEPSSNRPRGQSQQKPVVPERKKRPISRPPTRRETRRPGEKQKDVSGQRVKDSLPKQPAVFLRPASSGIRPQGYRIVKKAEEADWIANVASYNPVVGTSADIPHSLLDAPVNELGKSIAVASVERTHKKVYTESKTGVERSTGSSHRSAKEDLLLHQVRTALNKMQAVQSDVAVSTPLAQEAKIVPFPTSHTTPSGGARTSGGRALATVISLSEKREQLKRGKAQSARVARTVSQPTKKSNARSESSTVPIPSKPRLRLVSSQNGILPKEAPDDAVTNAPVGSPSIAVRPTETSRPALTVIRESDAGTDTVSPGGVRTTDPNEAVATITVGRKQKKTNVSHKSNSTSEISHPSDNSPKNLNASDAQATVAKVIKKVDGAQTAKQIEKAFEQKAENHIEEEITAQLEQATSETSQAETSEIATSHGAEQTVSESSIHHQQDESGATEKVTKRKVEVAPGVYEERYVTEKIERKKTAQTNKDDVETASEDHVPAEQETQTVNSQNGTNEEAQRIAGQQQPASVTPISSRRKKQQRSHSSSHTATAQVAASDGYYLPTDPFGARDAFRQAFAEIAA